MYFKLSKFNSFLRIIFSKDPKLAMTLRQMRSIVKRYIFAFIFYRRKNALTGLTFTIILAYKLIAYKMD